jgi:hypothetical protein
MFQFKFVRKSHKIPPNKINKTTYTLIYMRTNIQYI